MARRGIVGTHSNILIAGPRWFGWDGAWRPEFGRYAITIWLHLRWCWIQFALSTDNRQLWIEGQLGWFNLRIVIG